MKYINWRLALGGLLLVTSIVVSVGITVGVITGGYNEKMSAASFIAFAVTCMFLPIALPGGFLVLSGLRAAGQVRETDMQQRLLDITSARVRISIRELAAEMRVTEDEVKNLLYTVVGRKRFSGHIHWNDGILYAKSADNLLRQQQCPHCGGRLAIAGKGMVVCQFCGTETFIS